MKIIVLWDEKLFTQKYTVLKQPVASFFRIVCPKLPWWWCYSVTFHKTVFLKCICISFIPHWVWCV